MICESFKICRYQTCPHIDEHDNALKGIGINYCEVKLCMHEYLGEHLEDYPNEKIGHKCINLRKEKLKKIDGFLFEK